MIIEKIDNDFLYHFFNGTLINAYEYFGAHVKKRDNVIVGCEFLIFAPNTTKVTIIGEFSNFKEVELTVIKEGFYYIYIEGNLEYNEYKYVLYTKDNEILYKSDPYAFFSAYRPNNNSKVYDIEGFNYTKYKRKSFEDKAIVIYEMHIGSWNNILKNSKYNEMVDDLITYLLEHKYTHVEFLPLSEHPLDDSWGYMTTGYYSATSRYGSPKDLMYLIDRLHQVKINVILDYVLSHICCDDFGMYRFDGSYLYEYNDEFKRENYNWGTANLDFSKGITKSFLLSNMLFWINYYKIDGFRIDAVSNIIYYLGNEDNGENIDAVNFLKTVSTELKKYDKNILLIAEDSSTYLNVTKESPIGLGFDYKWNMGWMNDTLKYFKLDPIYRKYHHDYITFSFTYCFNEKFVLAISHDEVVHMKNSLINKMNGNIFDKFANMKLFLGYMFTHPGKKLLFMGQEFAVYNEWDFKNKLDFDLYNNEFNSKLNLFYKDITKIYLKEKALYKTDNSPKLFHFIEANNKEQSIFIFSRIYNDEYIVIILNMLPIHYSDYNIGVEYSGLYKELINSDSKKYNGGNNKNRSVISTKKNYHGLNNTVNIALPSLSIIILKHKIIQ